MQKGSSQRSYEVFHNAPESEGIAGKGQDTP